MKFMKLGSKPDAFQSDGSNVRYVVSDLATDVIIHVGEIKFYLHKFPLLSKSSQLQRLVLKASEDSSDEVFMHDFPGGAKTFEICAKFCYGMIVTLNAYNVVAARCAAEYLEMTEDMDRGNLIFKIEVFLNSSVFRSWKDSIIVLQTTKALLPWSEELKVVGRCIDSIASKTSVDPANVNWSYTYSKKLATSNEIIETQDQLRTVPKDWWIEDLCELDIDLYKRVMVAVKSKGRMSADVIGEALKAYAIRWLPESYDALVADDYTKRNKTLVETIVLLLPADKGSGCSCRFLLKLLKIVILVGADEQLKEELLERISMQLHKASVKDLMIPSRSPAETIYDVDLVQTLIIRFMVKAGITNDADFLEKHENEMIELNLDHEYLLTIGNLVDGYLAEVACDPSLPLSSFIELSTSVPEAARPIHDGLYTAIDIYLKEHPSLTKAEKKTICALMDVKKLSTNACIHAAQNDHLPLRVVVQVLFFEQVRAAAGGITAPTLDAAQGITKCTSYLEEDWEGPGMEHPNSLKKQVESQKQVESLQVKEECHNNGQQKSRNSIKDRGGRLLLSSRSRRIFDKFWTGKGHGENNKSSETSGSSHSPPTSVKVREVKHSVTPKSRRNSVS
ncbi:phototropic-responsive NPH3 family protein NPY1-like [Typha angustifolia]|uniref:phototropic-responsive NPH3 family protein NPY1-like n=1 Tax=Typha angustifolia TaxID=59011 RepID=UPI003C305604